jgi:hypothetical protein
MYCQTFSIGLNRAPFSLSFKRVQVEKRYFWFSGVAPTTPA